METFHGTHLGWLTLRKKILLLMAVVVVGLISSTWLIVDLVTGRAINTTLENDLNRTQALFKKSQEMRAKEMSAESRLIGEIPFLKALISAKEKATVLGMAKGLQQQIESDLILITDAYGDILGSTEENYSAEDILANSSMKKALEGKEAPGIMALGDQIYQVKISPVKLGPDILGTITIGLRIDDKFAKEIKEITNSEISLIIGRRIVASSMTKNQRGLLKRQMEPLQARIAVVVQQKKPSQPFDLELDGRYAASLVPFGSVGGRQGVILIQRSRDEITQFLDTIRKTTLLVSLFILILASGISYRVARQISDPITLIAKSSEAMAEGDFSVSVEIKQRDEIGILGSAFNEMGRRLGGLIIQVRENMVAVSEVTRRLSNTSDIITREIHHQEGAVADTSLSIAQMGASIKEHNKDVEVLSASASDTSSSIMEMDANIGEVVTHMDELSDSIDVTSSSIGEMASNIQEIMTNLDALDTITGNTASSLHGLNASVQQVERHAHESHRLSEDTVQGAKKGMESVHETIDGMEKIQTSFAQLQEIVLHLSEKSESIGKIVKVISEVTAQTNLLSLNAAIIAAQAGDHGKGFAVVAEEIKSLADRTATSAREISTLIKGVQDETANAVEAMARGSENVKKGAALSNEAGEVLKTIIDSSQHSSEMVSEIVGVAKEQSKEIQNVDRSMSQIKEMVKQIHGAIREQDQAGGEITKAVENMRGLGRQVKLSTEEQRQGSKLITAASHKVTEMIKRSLQATQEQHKGADRIHNALLVFKEAMAESIKNSAELNKMVATLSSRSQNLEQEIARFKTGDG